VFINFILILIDFYKENKFHFLKVKF